MKISEIKTDDNAYSGFKASQHRGKIQMLKDGLSIAPPNIQVDLEGYCPHDCNFCAYRNAGWNKRGQVFFKEEWAKGLSGNVDLEQENKPKGKRVEEVSGFPKKIAMSLPQQMDEAQIPSIELTGGGEPTSYPYFDEFIKELVKYENIEVALVTNGQLLSKKRVDVLNDSFSWLRFSIDSANARTHAKVHGVPTGVFDIVMKNIEYAVNVKKKRNKLGISFIVNPDNYTEIVPATQKFKEMGVDNIRFSFVYDTDGYGRLKEDQLDIVNSYINIARDHEDKNFKVFGGTSRLDFYDKPNTDFTFCGYQHFTYAIGYDCLIYPCCIEKYIKGKEFGDLRKQTLFQIIHSKERQEYLSKFNVTECHSCWFREKNQYIEYQLQDNPIHKNFV